MKKTITLLTPREYNKNPLWPLHSKHYDISVYKPINDANEQFCERERERLDCLLKPKTTQRNILTNQLSLRTVRVNTLV